MVDAFVKGRRTFYENLALKLKSTDTEKEELTMGLTEQDLKEAFAGESQANRRYLAFAKAAEKEGYPQVAKLFRAAAEAETVHAHNHLRALGAIGSTVENLEEAISGETHEFKKMYPAMIEHAMEDGHKMAERSFKYANEVEKVHAALYQNALAKMDGLAATDYYVCSVCGYTCEGEAPDKCPVCNAVKKAFFKVD
jgi:rubrerythrin